jgi:polar amino acid transport system substrate-binding protein
MAGRAGAIARLLLGLALPMVATAAEVTLRADPWYPYNGDPHGERPGYMVEIARYALARGGHRLDYQLLPWQRSLDAAERGRIDCVVGVHLAAEGGLLFPSESFGRMDEVFFGLRDAPPWRFRSTEDLRDKVVAVVGGYRYGDPIDAYIAEQSDSRRVYVASGEAALERNIKMLLAGRVDLVLEAPAVFAAKARQMGVSDQVRELDRLGDPQNLYIACSAIKPSSEEYLRLFDAGIRELRRSGELQKILDKYDVEDWKQPAARGQPPPNR